MKRLVLTGRTEADVRAIARYTERLWGPDRRRAYLSQLGGRMAELCRHPDIGRPRDDLKPGYRCLRSVSHLIFYRVTESSIEVLRVLHHRMDTRGAVAGESDAET